MGEGGPPPACPISQISQRASSRWSASPNTAVSTSLSIAGDAMADSSWTVTRPSSTVTAFWNGLANMSVEKLRGKREEGSGKQEAGGGRREAERRTATEEYQPGAVGGAASSRELK